MTIKDTRKMGSLTLIVESKLEPTYFDDEDNRGTEEDISEGKSYNEKVRSMIRIYHNHTLQTNPQHREEEPQNIYSNNTSLRQ